MRFILPKKEIQLLGKAYKLAILGKEKTTTLSEEGKLRGL